MNEKEFILTYYWCSKCRNFHLHQNTKIFWNHLEFKIPIPKNWNGQKYERYFENLSKKIKNEIEKWKKINNELSTQTNVKVIKYITAIRNHLENELLKN